MRLCRYAAKWLTTTKKTRVSDDWWESLLSIVNNKQIITKPHSPKHNTAVILLDDEDDEPSKINDGVNSSGFSAKRQSMKCNTLMGDSDVRCYIVALL